MKKRLSLVLAVALGIGSLTACGDTEKVEKAETKQVSTSEKKIAGSNETPTKRTVDLGSNKPWQAAAPSRVKEWQGKGETVYLWSDASELENMTLESINIKDHQDERMPAVAEYLETFAKEVGPNVSDKKEYFNKLNETASDLKSMNLDSAKTKIEEAKKLREAK
ncbi:MULTISPECIES: hypothetical protein [Bacillus]|uniref:hypothetical protein n=1 Tax=Bacillus TaxID=1386 RepID=UPI003980C205